MLFALPGLVLLSAQTPPTVGESFVRQCSQAILAIHEGRLAYRAEGDGDVLETTLLIKGDETLTRVTQNGKPAVEVLSTPTSYLLVNHTKRQYSTSTFEAQPKQAPEPLAALEPGNFQLNFDGDRGLVFRSNPPFVNPKVTIKDGQELLTGIIKGTDHTANFVLSRNEKTKLPMDLVIKSKGKVVTAIHITCESRSVAPSEMAIDPSGYGGYSKVDPNSNVSGTL